MKKLLLLLLPIFFLLPNATHAAVAFGHASSKDSANVPGTSISWSHDATGDDYLIVALTFRAAVTGISLTYNGVSMTQLSTNSNTFDYQYVYGLANPSTGSNTVSASWTTSTYSAHTAASFSGVGSLGTITTGTAPADTNNTTATATGVTDGMVVGLYAIPDTVTTVAVVTGTERVEVSDNGTIGSSIATNTGNGSVDITWSHRAELQSWIAVPLVPAAAVSAFQLWPLSLF